MSKQLFQLVTEFEPAGDQPAAIAQLTEGVRQGKPHQVLLGVTGSGKTFSIAHVINNIQKPTLILVPKKIFGCAVVFRIQGIISAQRGGIFCQLLRLLSARSVHAGARCFHRKRFFH